MRPKRTGSAIGERIRIAADSAGLSLRELSDRIGVSRPTIYAYVSGALRVPHERLMAIAQATGFEPDYFQVESNGYWELENNRDLAIELVDALLDGPNPEKAISFALQAATNLEMNDGDIEKAMLWQRIGNALTLSGKYLEAIPYLEHAQNWYKDAGRFVDASDCAQSLGYCYINLGRLGKSQACFEFALKNAPDQTRWKPLISLAALAERRGEFKEAAERLHSIADVDKLGNSVLAYVKANQASIATTRGFWKESLSLNLDALDYAQKSGFQDQITERMIYIARACLKQGLREPASLWLIRALDAARMTQDTARETLAQLVQASLYSTLNDWKTAREITIQTLATATRQQYRRSEACALLQLVEIANARGDHESARGYALQALSFGEAHSYYVVTCLANIHLACILLNLGNFAESKVTLDALLNDSKLQMLGEPKALAHSAHAQWLASQSQYQEAVAESRRCLQIADQAGAGLLVLEETFRLIDYLKQVGNLPEADRLSQEAERNKRAFEQQHVFLLNSQTEYDTIRIPEK